MSLYRKEKKHIDITEVKNNSDWSRKMTLYDKNIAVHHYLVASIKEMRTCTH